MAATSGKERQSEIRNRLISLVYKAKVAPLVTDSIYRVVAREFEVISEARANRIPWNEITKACGFPAEKENRLRDAFTKERRRQAKKEKEVMPEKKKEIMPDAMANIRKESTPFRPEDKGKGGRIGPPKPIGRGRLDLGCDAEDDEL